MLKILAAAGIVLSALTYSAVTANAASYGMSSRHISPRPNSAMMMMAPATRMRTGKGSIWVDARGFALYTFDRDARGRSNCYGACAIAWPPFTAPMGALPAGRWTLVTRFMGMKQWAYDGHPLYFWFKDRAPGMVTGDGIDGFHVAR